MTASAVHEPRAWTGASIDRPEGWYERLPSRCLSLLDAKVRALRQQPRPITDVLLTDAERAACARDLRAAAHALEEGRGFVIVHGAAADEYSPTEMTALYWLVGQALGIPFAQNVQGVLLYDVRDTGQDLSQGARFSVTSYESSFHTDNSFGADVLDYVGLLCLQTARSGGVSQIVNGFTVYEELHARHPDALAVLCAPFHVDQRGGVRPGEAPTVLRPVIEMHHGDVLFRYLRYWIEAGHDKAAVPLTPAQRTALDTLDSVLARPELRIEFELRPGDMYFLNNRWLLHNRTAFEDHPEPERRRHLVRLWLQARPPAP
jgi:alpha-ketoglutarate-dependent taurine dioxygenase